MATTSHNPRKGEHSPAPNDMLMVPSNLLGSLCHGVPGVPWTDSYFGDTGQQLGGADSRINANSGFQV